MRPLPNTTQNSSSESLKKLNTFHVNEAHAQRPLPNSLPRGGRCNYQEPLTSLNKIMRSKPLLLQLTNAIRATCANLVLPQIKPDSTNFAATTDY